MKLPIIVLVCLLLSLLVCASVQATSMPTLTYDDLTFTATSDWGECKATIKIKGLPNEPWSLDLLDRNQPAGQTYYRGRTKDGLSTFHPHGYWATWHLDDTFIRQDTAKIRIYSRNNQSIRVDVRIPYKAPARTPAFYNTQMAACEADL